jgi:hypothetical protein
MVCSSSADKSGLCINGTCNVSLVHWVVGALLHGATGCSVGLHLSGCSPGILQQQGTYLQAVAPVEDHAVEGLLACGCRLSVAWLCTASEPRWLPGGCSQILSRFRLAGSSQDWCALPDHCTPLCLCSSSMLLICQWHCWPALHRLEVAAASCWAWPTGCRRLQVVLAALSE